MTLVLIQIVEGLAKGTVSTVIAPILLSRNNASPEASKTKLITTMNPS